jgi:hypothetical protein
VVGSSVYGGILAFLRGSGFEVDTSIGPPVAFFLGAMVVQVMLSIGDCYFSGI